MTTMATMTTRAATLALAIALMTMVPRPVRAVGLEGDASPRRIAIGLGLGWDNVGGVGHQGQLTSELWAQVEHRWRYGLALAGGLALRRDLYGYDFALSRGRGGSFGATMPLSIGFDSRRFHLGIGPALTMEGRHGDRSEIALLPLGTLRLRVGTQDGWNVGVTLLEELPVATGGGPIGARASLGLPRLRDGRRVRVGAYLSAAEWTAGLSASHEWPRSIPCWAPMTALRIGLIVGSGLGRFGRIELGTTAAIVY